MFMSRVRTFSFLAAIAGLLVAVSVPTATAEEKIKITKLDDLPRHTYEISGKPSEVINSDEAFTALMMSVKKDIEAILKKYDIEDATTMQRYYGTLQTIAFLERDFKKSQKYLAKSRELEKKEPQKLVMGMLSESYVDALKKHDDPGADAFKEALRMSYAAKVEALPWEVVQEILEQVNGQMQIITENLLVGLLQNQLDPAVEKSGFLSSDQASQLVRFRNVIDNVIPYKDEIASVLGAAIAAHRVEKEDIWGDRNVTLTGKEGYSPVLVAVWDSGVDVDVFDKNRFTNPNEKVDGVDNDKNGFVDDVHGIAYDINHDKTPDLLYSLQDKEAERTHLENRMKGFTDLTASINSPEASEITKEMQTLEQTEVKEYIEALTLYSYHAHGTHVAGIALEGNPYASVMAARLSFDHHMIPQPETVERAEKFGKNTIETVRYFKDNGVRVVNMSWGLSIKEVEASLEANGIGDNAEQRGKMAREIFDIAKNKLYAAIESAPEVLFIASAGNADNDVEFDDFIPSSFDLPNLLINGAVDQAGEATSFTSGGKTVAVYANGFEVDSYVPKGKRMKMSGTSMSSPNVANLAAKLLARDPSLTPTEVIQLIKDGAEDFGKDKPMLVINPRRSMDLLEQRMAKKSG